METRFCPLSLGWCSAPAARGIVEAIERVCEKRKKYDAKAKIMDAVLVSA